MAISITCLLALLSCATANIIFTFIQPTCDYHSASDSCLQGQVCLLNDTCASVTQAQFLAIPRSDGRCGQSFDDAVCDLAGPYGGCCSQYGYCGSTSLHCLVSNGCQSGCDPVDAPPSSTSSLSEPVIGPGASASQSPSSASPVSSDGTCGVGNGGTICGDWPLGSCCSMYGFCGDSIAHCGKGCQSGPCDQAPAIPAPGPSPAPLNPLPGRFRIVGDSGVPAMHAALMPNGRVVFLDKIENYTKLELPTGQLAYSSEYDPETNTRVPLSYKSNAFCSGGSFLRDGTLVNVGGNGPLPWLDPTVGDGFHGLRYLSRTGTDVSLDGIDWSEPGDLLNTPRWYASVQTMPDGTLFVASGSLNGLTPTDPKNNNPTYEALDQQGRSLGGSIFLPLLKKVEPYYMYPFIHLLADSTLFIFA